MTDLRDAARQALEALKSCSGVPHWPALQPTITALRAALAESANSTNPVVESEPVAWTLTETLDKRETTTTGYLWFSDPQNSAWTPLYTNPHCREWRGLTEEENIALWLDHVVLVFGKHGINPILFARAIEAALKERNA